MKYFLIHGNFIKESNQIQDNSLDLIFTDPPYSWDFIPLYGDLARVAFRVLKEGGSLVTFAGHYAIPEILDQIKSASPHMKYWRELAVKHNGATVRMHSNISM